MSLVTRAPRSPSVIGHQACKCKHRSARHNKAALAGARQQQQRRRRRATRRTGRTFVIDAGHKSLQPLPLPRRRTGNTFYSWRACRASKRCSSTCKEAGRERKSAANGTRTRNGRTGILMIYMGSSGRIIKLPCPFRRTKIAARLDSRFDWNRSANRRTRAREPEMPLNAMFTQARAGDQLSLSLSASDQRRRRRRLH